MHFPSDEASPTPTVALSGPVVARSPHKVPTIISDETKLKKRHSLPSLVIRMRTPHFFHLVYFLLCVRRASLEFPLPVHSPVPTLHFFIFSFPLHFFSLHFYFHFTCSTSLVSFDIFTCPNSPIHTSLLTPPLLPSPLQTLVICSVIVYCTI